MLGKPVINVIVGGALLSMFYVPMLFLLFALASIPADFMIYAAIAVAAVMGICSCFAAISSSKKQALLKWLVSVPLSVLFFLLFTSTDFPTRASAYFNPSYYYYYGDNTMGNGLILMVLLFALSLAVLLGIIIGLSLSGIKMSEKAENVIFKLQSVACSAVGIVIIIFAVYLMIVMPSPAREIG